MHALSTPKFRWNRVAAIKRVWARSDPLIDGKKNSGGLEKKEIQAGKMFHILIAFNLVDTAGSACGRRVALNQENPITKRFDNDREG